MHLQVSKICAIGCEEQMAFKRFELQYFLIENEIEYEIYSNIKKYAIQMQTLSFGIGIRKISNGVMEERLVHNITIDRDKITQMIQTFAENLVMPDNLIELLDDIIGI